MISKGFIHVQREKAQGRYANFEELCEELAVLMFEVKEGLTEKNDHMMQAFKLQKDIYKLLGMEMYKIGLYMGYTIADF